MQRLAAFFGGIISGGIIGTVLALLLTPESGDTMRASLRERWAAAVKAGETAAAQKREELQARLVEVTGPHPPDSPMLSGDKPSSNGRS